MPRVGSVNISTRNAIVTCLAHGNGVGGREETGVACGETGAKRLGEEWVGTFVIH